MIPISFMMPWSIQIAMMTLCYGDLNYPNDLMVLPPGPFDGEIMCKAAWEQLDSAFVIITLSQTYKHLGNVVDQSGALFFEDDQNLKALYFGL